MVPPAEPEERSHEPSKQQLYFDTGVLLEALYRENWAWLVAYARRLDASARTDIATDVVADVFASFATRPRRIEADKVRAYLATAVARTHRDRTGRKRRQEVPASELVLEEQVSTDPSPAQVFEGREQLAAVARALETLPPRQREVVTLQMAGLTLREIAAVLAIDQASATQLRSRAMRKLRAVLSSTEAEDQ